MNAPPRLEVWVPGVVESPNALWRRHPMARHTRVKAVVAQVGQLVKVHALMKGVTVTPPVAVDFCLVRRRLFDEGDNLNTSLKAHRDGLMRAIGGDDGRLSGNTFTYRQRLAQGRPEGVEITITPHGVPRYPMEGA